MNKTYDLSQFVANEEKQRGVIDFGSFKVTIKEDAWTYLQIQRLLVKHEQEPDQLVKAILSQTLSAADLAKVTSANISVQGREQMVFIIIGHIFGLKVDKDNIDRTIKDIQSKVALKKKPPR